jgi:transcription antitermination factor NusG
VSTQWAVWASQLSNICIIKLCSGSVLLPEAGFGRAMRWYVLRSKPNKEQALCNEVDARGLQAFYPCLHVKPVNPRSHKTRPYFPGYLFVRVKLAGVGPTFFARLPQSQGLVSFGGEPSEVPEGLVQAIRKRVDEINAAGGEQLVSIEKGEIVEIQDGPFAGYKAIFDAQVAGNERVRVLLKLLQQQTLKVELPAGQIKRTTRR